MRTRNYSVALDLWKLADFDPGEGASAGAFKNGFDDTGWLDITAPGDIHRALVEAGRLPEPFHDRNEDECRWVEEREWWYRASFTPPDIDSGEHARLVFHGADTFITVWLNGREIGSHENMFREADFDVSDALRPGEVNTLALCFGRPLDHSFGVELAETSENTKQWGRNPERVAMRKAQFGFGWDWGPRLPTIGLWRSAELRLEKVARIEGLHFRTLDVTSSGSEALVAATLDVEVLDENREIKAKVSLSSQRTGEVEAEELVTLDVDANSSSSCRVYMKVSEPRLWWTHDLGSPELYELSVTLVNEGETLDKRSMDVGIRTIELDQSPDPDEPGTRFFRFVLNGVPIFARGADWIPADSFVGAIEEGRYERLVSAAQDANMNMLRVWGGGIYEHDAFYEFCDRQGLLVWQDFMFACAAYPEHKELAEEVEAEARYQIKRLRNHPSLALWCGCNENQWIHDRTFPERRGEKVPGSLYYDEILPRAVSELDGATPYWPGSPYGGDDHNDRRQGNVHNWEVWHGNHPRKFGEPALRDPSPENVSYLRYAEDMGRFISEFGMHAAPVAQTLKRVIPADQLYHHSPAMDHHNKDEPKNKGDNLMQTVTGLPKTLEEYIDFSMISQAEGLKFAIEHFRRRKPHCSGTLFWQLNDCWPVQSWSVIDYYGFGKAGYYYVKRAYAPLLASFKQLDDGTVELWMTNDTLDEIDEAASVSLKTFRGETLREESLELDIAPNSSRAVARWAADKADAAKDRYLTVRSSRGTFPDNRHFFYPVKDLARDPIAPRLEVVSEAKDELEVSLRADSYAYFVNLKVEDPATRFSDNYFDIEPGSERRVTISSEGSPITRDMLSIGYR